MIDLIFSPSQLFPDLAPTARELVRIAYGVLLFGTLVQAIPQARRFFLSERWRGYAKSSRGVDALQNPVIMPLILVVWIACSILLVIDRWTLAAAGVNLVIARYFFVHMRWKSVVRGLGAPGLMSYWLAAAVFLLEYTSRYAPDLQRLALLVLQVDFAFIILSAGVYKYTAGYPRNHGMELGMANPEWGYWWRFYQKLPPSHWIFKTLNHLAWTTEVVAAILMLIPPTRFLGGVLIIVSFAFIATHIRLGLLCEMVMVCGLLFAHPGSAVEVLLAGVISPDTTTAANAFPVAGTILQAALWAYLFLLPVAHAGMYYNFYARKRLPGFLQVVLERYTNLFGMIIWRVFSIDLTNFWIEIYDENPAGERKLLSDWGHPLRPRYVHVAEAITVTSLFTTLKYYPSNPEMFHERLLRYARTVSHAPGSTLVFRYIAMSRNEEQFIVKPAAEYRVNVDAATIEEVVLTPDVSVRAAHAVSPVHEGVRPGSYVPLTN